MDAILRLRPEWNDKLIRGIRESDCLQWAAEYSGKVHGTRFNNTVGTLRAIFDLGLRNRLLADNPARSIRKARGTAKKLRLPSAEQFGDSGKHRVLRRVVRIRCGRSGSIPGLQRLPDSRGGECQAR